MSSNAEKDNLPCAEDEGFAKMTPKEEIRWIPEYTEKTKIGAKVVNNRFEAPFAELRQP